MLCRRRPPSNRVGCFFVSFTLREDRPIGAVFSCFGVGASQKERGEVPVINYNDPLSFAAIELLLKQANDNDKLTADFAPHIGAKAVLFLTEAGGVHDGHPANGGTRLYQEIDWRNPPFIESAKPAHGRGGMSAKVTFAIECRKQGIKRVAIIGLTHDVILRFARGEDVSTIVGNRNTLV